MLHNKRKNSFVCESYSNYLAGRKINLHFCGWNEMTKQKRDHHQVGETGGSTKT